MIYVQAFFTTVKLVSEIMGWIKEQEKDSAARLLTSITETFADVRKAKTTEERKNAARRLHDLVSG